MVYTWGEKRPVAQGYYLTGDYGPITTATAVSRSVGATTNHITTSGYEWGPAEC